jgi:hypothetical protein
MFAEISVARSQANAVQRFVRAAAFDHAQWLIVRARKLTPHLLRRLDGVGCVDNDALPELQLSAGEGLRDEVRGEASLEAVSEASTKHRRLDGVDREHREAERPGEMLGKLALARSRQARHRDEHASKRSTASQAAAARQTTLGTLEGAAVGVAPDRQTDASPASGGAVSRVGGMSGPPPSHLHDSPQPVQARTVRTHETRIAAGMLAGPVRDAGVPDRTEKTNRPVEDESAERGISAGSHRTFRRT